MAEYITLMGAEQVKNAGFNMLEAADKISRSTLIDHGTLTRLENLFERIEFSLNNLAKTIEEFNTMQNKNDTNR